MSGLGWIAGVIAVASQSHALTLSLEHTLEKNSPSNTRLLQYTTKTRGQETSWHEWSKRKRKSKRKPITSTKPETDTQSFILLNQLDSKTKNPWDFPPCFPYKISTHQQSRPSLTPHLSSYHLPPILFLSKPNPGTLFPSRNLHFLGNQSPPNHDSSVSWALNHLTMDSTSLAFRWDDTWIYSSVRLSLFFFSNWKTKAQFDYIYIYCFLFEFIDSLLYGWRYKGKELSGFS